jgi:outer membrane protein assembly factor BamB
MKKKKIRALTVLAACVFVSAILFTGYLQSQQTRTVFSNPLRLDLRKLGHPPLDIIPPGESAITSLVIGKDGRLYGGTSGKRAHLFVLDPAWDHVFPLGHLPGEESIQHSLAAASDGMIWIGTSLFNKGRIDERGRDVLARYEDYSGGHIYKFDPIKERNSRKRMQNPDPERPLPNVTDMGKAIEGEGIVCLVSGSQELYGVTFPNGHFFVTDIKTGKTSDKGKICGPPINEEPFRSIPRSLLVDTKGRVWGSGDYGALFYYDPGVEKVVHLPELRLPSELGREFKTIVDAMVQGPDGIIYGGTSDGYIFRFDPETKKITNLGKPVMQNRIRGLAFSLDGDLYGMGGVPGGAVRLFVYRTKEGNYENLGLLDVNRAPYYAWLAYDADCMVTGKDGTIFIGETGRIAHLYILYPWK